MKVEIISCLRDNTRSRGLGDVYKRQIKIFKSLAINNKNASIISDGNLKIKNLFADLGLSLIHI